MTEPFKFADVLENMFKAGNYFCRQGCGAELQYPGLCDACGALPKRADESEVMALTHDARVSIPSRYDAASFDDLELLRKRCDPRAIEEAMKIRRWPVGIALVGERDSGKSTLAAASLRRIHDYAKAGSDLEQVKRIGTCLWVSYLDVEEFWKRADRYQATEEDRKAWERLERAYRLVIDNVEEDRHNSPVGKLVQRRFERDRPTMITTWMDEETAGRSFGGGVAKRMYQQTIRLQAPNARKLAVAS
jgi:DNA replication protein DnaC